MDIKILSLILNGLLGSGFVITLFTLRPIKRKAKADATGSELDNVQEAITIWREMAEKMHKELEEAKERNEKMFKELESLRRAVSRLTTVNNKMVKLLDKITPENLDSMIEQIKQIHNEN